MSTAIWLEFVLSRGLLFPHFPEALVSKFLQYFGGRGVDGGSSGNDGNENCNDDAGQRKQNGASSRPGNAAEIVAGGKLRQDGPQRNRNYCCKCGAADSAEEN